MASKINKGEILAKFFDYGEYTALFADGAVSAACGYAAGQQRRRQLHLPVSYTHLDVYKRQASALAAAHPQGGRSSRCGG